MLFGNYPRFRFKSVPRILSIIVHSVESYWNGTRRNIKLIVGLLKYTKSRISGSKNVLLIWDNHANNGNKTNNLNWFPLKTDVSSRIRGGNYAGNQRLINPAAMINVTNSGYLAAFSKKHRRQNWLTHHYFAKLCYFICDDHDW